MAKPAEVEALRGTASRFGAFVAERHPFALEAALAAYDAASGGGEPKDEAAFEALRAALVRELTRRLQLLAIPAGLAETTPRVAAEERLRRAHRDLVEDCDGFMRRLAIEASLTRDERVELLRGMVLARATDNRLKS